MVPSTASEEAVSMDPGAPLTAQGRGEERGRGEAQPQRISTFADSHFKKLYLTAGPADEETGYTIAELREALVDFCEACVKHPGMLVDSSQALSFAKRLEAKNTTRQLKRGLSRLKADDARTKFAIRLWTSPQRWSGRELCSLLNQAIREDGQVCMETLQHGVHLCRALNEVLCLDNQSAKKLASWPEGPDTTGNNRSDVAHTTFRGGGLPDDHQAFFQPGVKFRSRMYVASSFKRSVAHNFGAHFRTPADSPQVLWTLRFDPTARCHHACLVESLSKVQGESEFLLPPYSAFTVESVDWDTRPCSIVLSVAPDNRGEAEDLPTAPWG